MSSCNTEHWINTLRKAAAGDGRAADKKKKMARAFILFENMLYLPAKKCESFHSLYFLHLRIISNEGQHQFQN